EVATLDGILDRGGVERFRELVRKCCVALELHEREGRAERSDGGPDEVGEDVLGVVELGSREEARVARDVGDQQTGRLRLAQHPVRPSSWSSSAETGSRVDRLTMSSPADPARISESPAWSRAAPRRPRRPCP